MFPIENVFASYIPFVIGENLGCIKKSKLPFN